VNLIHFGGKYKPTDSELGRSLYSAGGLVTLEYSAWGGRGGGFLLRGTIYSVTEPFGLPVAAIARVHDLTVIASVALRKGLQRLCPHRSDCCRAL